MENNFGKILSQNEFSQNDILKLLSFNETESQILFQKSREIKEKFIGKKVYYRGLIEFSNICQKNCFYCGIRAGNSNVLRYTLTEEEVFNAVKFAYENQFGSLVLQSGEQSNEHFTELISHIILKIKELSKGTLGITLSLGEQTQKTYEKWFAAGAHRYLLRIETSNKNLYQKLHPNDEKHSFEKRLECLKMIKNIGFQTGTGVMIGLPFQTLNDLAADILFFRDFDIDMIGMGPYIEHEETPFFQYSQNLSPLNERFFLSLKMLAVARVVLRDINIAATTALQAIDAEGREKALKIAANILMPNLTPSHREDYQLYKNKPFINERKLDLASLETKINNIDLEVARNEWGDSQHFKNKNSQK